MERGVLTEQRTNIKFFMKLSKSRWDMLEMLETVYGESAMNCEEWKHGGSPRSIRAHKCRSKIRIMLVVFFIYIFEE
jgi:hypothetical protein